MAGVARISWWHWILPRGTWRVIATVDAADEIPQRLPRNSAVLVGSFKRPKWLAFDCPCRTGHRIMVTLDPSHVPHWNIAKFKPLTLEPSVDYRNVQRRCHYIIRRGRVVWV